MEPNMAFNHFMVSTICVPGLNVMEQQQRRQHRWNFLYVSCPLHSS